MKRYNPREIEQKWQAVWAKTKLYEVDTAKKPASKFYVIPMLPYTSGNLHVGHWYCFGPTDTVARWRRMMGRDVFTTIGFDAFGLPAENAAIKNKVPAAKWTRENIANMTEQLKTIGASYDWTKQINTSDPNYYRWTQWLFLKLYEKGLAYRAKAVVNWCPKDKTVLANEQVVGEQNVCERCGTPVIQKELEQWFFKITDYADWLLEDLVNMDWPERVKTMQINWIGKSAGAEIDFVVDGTGDKIKVFTTRADTIFGATFMVLAPEHPLVKKLATKGKKASINSYIAAAKRKTELERKAEKAKTGVFTGSYAINPASQTKIPIWIADYVLMSYGTGAIMAVPAHDERDGEFARKYKLPIQPVIAQDFGESLPNEQYVEGVVVVGYDPKTKRFLALDNWHDGIGLVGGGRNDSESFEANARRELAEETGIEKVKALIPLGGPLYSHYFNDLKNVNRFSYAPAYLAIVDAKDAKAPKLESHEIFKPAWFEMPEIRAGVQKLSGSEHWLEITYRAEAAAAAYDKNQSYEPAPYEGEGILINSPGEPVFEQHEEPGAIKADQPFVERQAITAIVKHWSEDKYLGLKWKKVKWGTWITGGVEAGQTPEAAAIAEIIEETGYLHPVLKKTLAKTQAKFYHVPKQENRHAHFSNLYFELADGEQAKTSKQEQAIHDIVWLKPSEVEKFLTAESHLYAWADLRGQTAAKDYNGLNSAVARDKIIADLAKTGAAKEHTNYKLRDWLISRQRYWGPPIPMVYCNKCGLQPVPEKDLPVVLPEDVKFNPAGQSPLKTDKQFINTTCPKCAGLAKRETDTMDTFVDSSWYFLRYPNPDFGKGPYVPEIINNWGPVDHYIGGIEHAILHLLYARFIVRFLHDHHGLQFEEPFLKLTNNGIIAGPDGQKMSKSRGNVVSPDEQVKSYGADSLRLYLMFMGPYEEGGPYNLGGIAGTRRFLDRFWTLVQEFLAAKSGSLPDLAAIELRSAVHRTTKKISQDLEALGFNTAIAEMMSLLNFMYKFKVDKGLKLTPAWREAIETLTKLLAPFAPHIAEEIWAELGHETSIHVAKWPTWDDKLLAEETISLAVQVNGKLRGEIVVSSDVSEAEAIEAAKSDPKIAPHLKGKKLVKSIYVPGRLVSLVIA